MYLRNRFGEPPAPAQGFRVRVLRPTEPLNLGAVVARSLPLLAAQASMVGREVLSQNPRERLLCLLAKIIPAAALQKDKFFYLEFERDEQGRRRPGIPPRIVWTRVSGILTHPASFGPGVSNEQVLENLKQLDEAIHVARWFANFQVIVGGSVGGGSAIGPSVTEAFNFLKQNEPDGAHVYSCYRGGGPKGT